MRTPENCSHDHLRTRVLPCELRRGRRQVMQSRSFILIQTCKGTVRRRVSETANLRQMSDCRDSFSRTTECIILALSCGRQESSGPLKRADECLTLQHCW